MRMGTRGHVYPEEMIPVLDLPVDGKLRLVDDGYAKICQMVRSWVGYVRG